MDDWMTPAHNAAAMHGLATNPTLPPADRLQCALQALAFYERPHPVVGYCPMGCGPNLLLDAGQVTCGAAGCKQPDAVAQLLDDRESQHVVVFRDSDFTIRHPLRERIGDELLTCDLGFDLAGLDGPPVLPGRYRATQGAFGWSFAPVES